jgi:hypothetical protein
MGMSSSARRIIVINYIDVTRMESLSPEEKPRLLICLNRVHEALG